MRGDYKIVSLQGVNKELLNEQSPDGLCEDIVNLKPAGSTEQPYWNPVPQPKQLESEQGIILPQFAHPVTRAYWQLLGNKGSPLSAIDQYPDITYEYGAVKRLIALTQQDVNNDATLLLYKSDPSWTIIDNVNLGTGAWDFSATRIGDLTVIAVSKDGIGQDIYYLSKDNFVKAEIPELPQVELYWFNKGYITSDVEANETTGFQMPFSTRDVSDPRYIYMRYAYRLKDGNYIYHSAPEQHTISKTAEKGADDFFFAVPAVKLWGYQGTPNNLDLWSEYIDSVDVFISMPSEEPDLKDTYQFYNIASFPNINKFPTGVNTINHQISNYNEDDYFTIAEFNQDTLATREALPIDGLTNHKSYPSVIDSYNRRLLYGGITTDFALPAIKPNKNKHSHVLYVNSEIKEEEHIDNDPSNGSIRGWKETAYINITPSYEIASISLISGTVNIFDDLPNSPTFWVEYNIDNDEEDFQTNRDNFEIEVVVNNASDGSLYDTLRIVWQPHLNSYNRVGQGNAYIYSVGGKESDTNIVDVIEISTEKGIYKRVASGSINTYGAEYYIPNTISYPDKRATKYIRYIKAYPDYNKLFEYDLISHDRLNVSYFHSSKKPAYRRTDIYPTIDLSTILSQPQATDVDKASQANNIRLVEPGKLKASEVANPLYFDVAKTYVVDSRLGSKITAFGVNAIETSQGQFGQYPLYVFTNAAIYALEQTGEAEVAFGRITPISQNHFADNPDAIVNANRVTVFANSNGVYIINGANIDRISDPIYHIDWYNNSFARMAALGYNDTGIDQEIIISSPDHDYSIVFNMKYSAWYKVKQSYSGFFLEVPRLYGIGVDNKIYDFTNLDNDTEVDIILETKPMYFGNPFIKKRLYNTIIRGTISQTGSETQTLELEGVDTKRNTIHTFRTESKTDQVINDQVMHNKYGSVNGFIIKVNGKAIPEQTRIIGIEANYEMRKTSRIRK